MENWALGNNLYLILLLLVPVLAIILSRYNQWKKKRKNIFAEEKFQETFFDKKKRFSKILPVLYFLATFFLILAIIDLLHGSEEVESKQKLNNVIFALDVSNSMNAEDMEPNRLVQAKNIMIHTMSKMKNDRVGIVVFAGEAASIMPLTTDYTAAETYISGIETEMMKIQGTDFLKAMKESAFKFQNVAKGARKIVLISDGEDNEGNDDAAAKYANKEGMMVISVGVGTDEGAPVPEYFLGQLMGYKIDRTGETVVSKRQMNALEKIANNTGGSLIDGNNLETAPDQIVDELQKKLTTSAAMVKSQNANHYYQYPLAASLFFFLLIYLFNPKMDFNN